MSDAKEPDFESLETFVTDSTVRQLKAFTATHGDEVFCQFAFDCDPDNGLLLLCLDTPDSTRESALEIESFVTEKRKAYLKYDDAEYAIDTIQSNHTLVPFNRFPGDFAYQGFAEHTFDDWVDFSCADEYPGEFAGSGEDYIQSKAAIMLSRVIDNLVEVGAFVQINKSRPFLLSIAFHDTTHLVIRLINWPSNQ